MVLDVLRKHRLTVAVHKCSLSHPELLYLGHVVLAEGIATDPAKVKALREYPQPKEDIHQLRSFLGMCNYFRKFIMTSPFLLEGGLVGLPSYFPSCCGLVRLPLHLPVRCGRCLPPCRTLSYRSALLVSRQTWPLSILGPAKCPPPT